MRSFRVMLYTIILLHLRQNLFHFYIFCISEGFSGISAHRLRERGGGVTKGCVGVQREKGVVTPVYKRQIKILNHLFWTQVIFSGFGWHIWNSINDLWWSFFAKIVNGSFRKKATFGSVFWIWNWPVKWALTNQRS